MIRKYLVMIADAIAEERAYWNGSSPEASTALDNLAQRLASDLAVENPRFDRSRFLDACGVKIRVSE